MKQAIFINGAYFDNVLASFGNAKIDYKKFIQNVAKECDDEFIRAYYYHCPPYKSSDPTEEEEFRHSSKMKFFTALKHIENLTVYLGQLAFRGYNTNDRPIFVRRLVDVRMCFDIMRLAHSSDVDKLVLISGDNNLVDTIEYIKDSYGINVHLFHGPQSEKYFVHRNLMEVCDGSTEITEEMINSSQ